MERTLMTVVCVWVFVACCMDVRAGERGPLVCDKPHIDIGETQTRQQKHTFKLRNTSRDEVRITATHKACGCVKREFSKLTLAAGETSELSLDFPIRTKPGAIGDFTERMSIYVNDGNDVPALVVSVTGRLVPIAYLLRDGIYIEAPANRGADVVGRAELFLNKGRGIQIDEIETSGELPLKAAVVSREDTPVDGEEKVVLEVRGALGAATRLPAAAHVVVKLNSSELPEIGIPVSVYRKRKHEVRFSPQLVAFGVLKPGRKATKAVVVELPKAAGYSLEKVEPSGDAIAVTVEEKPKTPHVVIVRCELDTSGSEGSVNQELVVTVAVPDGPPEVYKLPISGFVKPAEKEPASKE